MDPERLRAAIAARVRRAEPALVGLSRRIHAHPEVAFEEEAASRWVAELLADAGVDVELGVADLPTALRGEVGTGDVTVAVCAEYDALPGLGHACGHNVIAAAAVGAVLGAAVVADEVGLRLRLLGTPAEEGGGGKALMLERGAFAGVDAAMMVHPAPYDDPTPSMQAVARLAVEFTGVASHAGAFPERGVNAADAMTVAQVGIGLLRAQTSGDDRVHGIVTDAGDAANVVPAHAAGRWIVRSPTGASVAALRDRVARCFEAGALASGATLSLRADGPDYAELRSDPELSAVVRGHLARLGRPGPATPAPPTGASTDMGNVSQVVPSIHPLLGLGCGPVVNHQPEFTAVAGSPAAERAVVDGALAMAFTAADLAGAARRQERARKARR